MTIIKNKLSAILLLLAVIFQLSCESVFNYNDDGSLGFDDVFSDYHLTGAFLNSCYATIPQYGQSSAGSTFISSFTDESQDIGRDRPLAYYNGETSSSNQIIMPNHFEKLYEGIRYCNIFIANVDKVPYFVIEENRNRWKGEAHIIRAHLMLQVIKRYGPMPILKEVLPVDSDFYKMEKPSFYDCAKAIMADCDIALSYPEVVWRYETTAVTASMTRAIAYAIKSQAILFAASPLWNDGENHWEEAADITKKSLDALTENGFALYDNVKPQVAVGAYGAYQDYFLSPIGEIGSKNKEAIYQNKNKMGALWSMYGLPFRKAEGVVGAGLSPVQELVDAYETTDGKSILNLEQPYLDENHLQPNYNPEALVANGGLYDPSNPYKNRDQRLRSTIYCNGDFHDLKSKKTPVWTYEGGNAQINEADPLYTVTGYYLRKFINWTSNKNATFDGYWSQYRMAEMFLNYAEAEYYANGATDAAYSAINAVRVRAKQPNLPVGLAADQFETRLRNERRVEFAFEEHRYFDLRRWTLNQNYEGVVTGMKITGTSAPFTYERFVVGKRAVTEDKYRMWPLSLQEEQRFSSLGIDMQNPGW